jgi:DNA-binding MarR family transcriptional regulator
MSYLWRALSRRETLSNAVAVGPRQRAIRRNRFSGQRTEWCGRVATVAVRLEPSLTALLHVGGTWGVRLDSALREVGLSPAEYCVLRSLVGVDESLSLGALADRAAGGSWNIMEVVDELEADGMVNRVRDPRDVRTIRVHVTPLGRQRVSAAARRVDAVSTRFEAAMPESDRLALGRIMSRLGQATVGGRGG